MADPGGGRRGVQPGGIRILVPWVSRRRCPAAYSWSQSRQNLQNAPPGQSPAPPCQGGIWGPGASRSRAQGWRGLNAGSMQHALHSGMRSRSSAVGTSMPSLAQSLTTPDARSTA